MNITMLFLLALGLSMDAFAVSVTNGMCLDRVRSVHVFGCGLCFGLFQGAMPVIGYALGSRFERSIVAYDHWIALILLSFIGGKMIFDACGSANEKAEAFRLDAAALIIQGFATSVDALAVGVSFAALSVNIVSAALFICLVTFAMSSTGVALGKRFGSRLGGKAQIIGGIILILIGLKIFAEHMF